MLIDRSGVAGLIPHAGAMCLIDGVRHWDALGIACATMTHCSVENPLRRDGQLGILCGVEYAAQAMALHAALVDGGLVDGGLGKRLGYLAGVRDVCCHVERLDGIAGELLIEAARLHGDAGGMIYRFSLRHEDRVLLDGRAVVVLGDGVLGDGVV
jgi:predicted hotdog family 3-hydroxylacyl-ACP dehydratase